MFIILLVMFSLFYELSAEIKSVAHLMLSSVDFALQFASGMIQVFVHRVTVASSV